MTRCAETIRQALLKRIHTRGLPVPLHMVKQYEIKNFSPGLLWEDVGAPVTFIEKNVKSKINPKVKMPVQMGSWNYILANGETSTEMLRKEEDYIADFHRREQCKA